MPSATDADSSDSSAARAATATAGASSVPREPGSRKDRDGAGRPEGRSPIGFAASRWASRATIVAAITATIENGTVGRHRAPSSMSAATATAKPTAVQFGLCANSPTARHVTTSTRSPSGLGTPSAFGTC